MRAYVVMHQHADVATADASPACPDDSAPRPTRFDLPAFKARWRDLCAANGLDPLKGAPYDYRAELALLRRRRARTPFDRLCWIDSVEAERLARAALGLTTRSAEADDALIDLTDDEMGRRRQSYLRPTERASLGLDAQPPLDVVEIVREVLLEMRDAHAQPLRELHRARGVEIHWIEVNKKTGAVVAVEQPLTKPAPV